MQLRQLGYLFAALLPISIATADEMPSQAEMWKMIQAQQKQIESLTKQLKATEDKTEAVTKVVEEQGSTAQTSTPGWWQNTQLSGYGELHYNGGDKDEVDFHRFVAMIGHQFSDRIRLYSEIELEHAVASSEDEDPGEVELEQAYVEFDLNPEHRLKIGQFLVPVGMLNEHHEPTTFFGVERNPVETKILPTTWWEPGLAVNGELAEGFKYDVALHSGLNTPVDGDGAFQIREGRQKGAKAHAEDGAVTARLRWSGISGVELGLSSQYQHDVTQGALEDNVDALLLAAHTDIRKGPWGLRALYAHWDLDSEEAELIGRDEQDGWFVEPGYYFNTDVGEFGIFGRYNRYDNESGDSADSEYEQIDFGLNYWPHKNVVLKADWAIINAPAGKEDDDLLNLGVGFNF